MKISSSDRSALIRLAASLPIGSPERRTILSGLLVSAKSVRGASQKTDKFLKELDLALGEFYGTKSHPPFPPNDQKRAELEELVEKTSDHDLEDILFTIGRGIDDEYDDDTWGSRLPKLYLFIREELG